MKNEIKIGNDGYGGKNVTVSKSDYGIEITKTDPHDWNRISGEVRIPSKDIDTLITFLINLKKRHIK